jgi:predicted transcriptional regulator
VNLCYNEIITKLLDQAIAKAKALFDENQNAIALTILSDVAAATEPLDEETRAAIREGLEQARRGEFVPEEEMDAFWKRHGL